jgi:hypothetical protein
LLVLLTPEASSATFRLLGLSGLSLLHAACVEGWVNIDKVNRAIP